MLTKIRPAVASEGRALQFQPAKQFAATTMMERPHCDGTNAHRQID